MFSITTIASAIAHSSSQNFVTLSNNALPLLEKCLTHNSYFPYKQNALVTMCGDGRLPCKSHSLGERRILSIKKEIVYDEVRTPFNFSIYARGTLHRHLCHLPGR